MKTPLPSALRCAFFFATTIAVFGQGSLTPPAAPAPTMVSLDQLDTHIALAGEKRTSIDATNTPGDANYEAVISAAGSYYLTGNLHVAKANGIHVTAAGVTIDLNGFQIDRASGSGGDGITIDGTANRCTVKSGSITDFTNGIRGNSADGGAFLGLAVSGCSSTGLLAGNGWRIEGCQAHDNTGTGFGAGISNAVTNCSALNNGGIGIDVKDYSSVANCTSFGSGSDGIRAGFSCTLTNCSASKNAYFGIEVFAGCALINCTANGNTSATSFSGGIMTQDYCSLENCSASLNSTTSATHDPDAGVGIHLGDYCSMQHCTASNNWGDGVSLRGSCLITGNNSSSNGFSGFRVRGTGANALNRIDGNIANTNLQIGIIWTNDFVVRNTAFGNSAFNYSPAVGTGNTGPLQAAGTATNPFANF